MYIILGSYKNGDPETLDEAEDLKTARYLVSEYRLSFGTCWTIKIVRKRNSKS